MENLEKLTKLSKRDILVSAGNFAKDKFQRYLGPEVIGTITAYGTALAAKYGFDIDNALVLGYIGAMGENLGFYGTVIPRQIMRDKREANAKGETYGRKGLQLTATKLALEFGIPELTDTPIIRPLAMSLGEKTLGTSWGIGVGKIVADALFYLQAGIIHELVKRNPEKLGDGSLSFLARRYIREPLQRRLR